MKTWFRKLKALGLLAAFSIFLLPAAIAIRAADHFIFPDLIIDAHAAIDFLAQRADIIPRGIGILANSQSGWFAPEVAVENANVTFVVARVSQPLPWTETVLFEVRNDLVAGGATEIELHHLLEYTKKSGIITFCLTAHLPMRGQVIADSMEEGPMNRKEDKMTQLRKLLVSIMLLVVADRINAQQAPGEFARVVIIKPKPGAVSEFMAGYERHLLWHKKSNDPWTWYGWFFVLGDRLDLFMDGTFGHALSNFDNAVNPTEDAADNQVNVVPFADFVSHGVYERLPGLSRGTPLPDRSPYLVLHTIVVRPGNEEKFESHFKGVDIGWVSVFKLRIGGTSTRYLVMRPAASFSVGASLSEIRLPADAVLEAKIELLRFQPAMSYFP